MTKTTPNTSQEVSQLQKELEVLVASKQRYQAIVETADHIIIGLKPDYTIFEWNKAAEKLHGWSREKALGTNYLEQFVPENERPRVVEEFTRVLLSTPTVQFENLILAHEEIRIISWNVTKLLNMSSELDGLIAIGQDVTNYRQATKEARQSAKKYHQLLVAEQRHVRDLALLDRLRSTLARELDLQKLIHSVVEAVAETFGYSYVSLYLLEKDTLILQHQVGYEHIFSEIKLNEGVSGRVARTGQPILLQNAQNDPEFLEAVAGISSEVSVPLFDQGKVVGTLNVESTGVIDLTEADLALVTATGEHVSIAIERARLYTEARRSEERFRVMFKSTPIGLAIAKLDGRLLEVNPAFCQVLGYTAYELLQMKVEDITYPQDIDRNERLREELAVGERESYEMEKRFIAKDGRIIHTILQVALVRDTTGNPLYSIGQIVDISERIRIEQAEHKQRLLAETLSRIGLAMNETLDLSALLNMICLESVNLLQVHSAFIWLVEGEEMIGFAGYGYGREKFIGLKRLKSEKVSLAARIIQNNQSEYINNAQQSAQLDIHILQKYDCQAVLGVPLAKGQEVIGALMIVDNRNPYRFNTNDLKTVSILASHAAVAIENARLVEDLEKRVAERTAEQQIAYEDLKKLDKLKTKLIEDISHELRTPAANILLYLDLMERGSIDRQPRYQKIIRSEVTRLTKLVEGIVRLSDIDLLRSEANFANVNLSLLVPGIVESFQQQADAKKLALIIEKPDDAFIVSGDKKQIAEALRHLLTNALNYTEEGQIHIRIFIDGNICVEVADTGIGIAAEDIPHIFDRFYRGQSVSQLTFPGAGLGLFVTQEIMNLHDGEVSVSSQVNEGSTFRLCFPAL